MSFTSNLFSKISKPFHKLLHRTPSQEDLSQAKTQLEELREQFRKDPLPSRKDDVYKPWPNNTNPHTGEIGGPTGPEPTRYGDWERNGIASDF